MEMYMRKKYKGIGEVTIMDATKKRKICDEDVKLMSPALLRFRSHSGVVEYTPADGSLVSPESSVSLKENYAWSEPEVSSTSCCSRNSKSLDLDENGVEVIVASKENTQMTLSGELESTKMPKGENSLRRITPSKHENSPRRITPAKHENSPRRITLAKHENSLRRITPAKHENSPRRITLAKHENSLRRITPAKHENSPRRIMPEKVPSRNEIEEFFAACQKDMFKRLREKYNFDFEEEEPLEGRYEWVQRIGT